MEYHIFKTSIVFSFDDDRENITIRTSDDKFEKCKKLINGKKMKQLEKFITTQIDDIKRTLTTVPGFDIVKNVVTYNNKPVDAFFGKKILEFKKAGKPYDYLFRFYKRVLENPSKNSQKQLFKFLMNNSMPITEDGYFIAYKAVNKNFTDKHTGSMDCSIGNMVTMEREKVTDNPNIACSAGLHIGSFNYAWNQFGGKTALTLAVLVDPADVVSVPFDYNYEKCRCCAYKPLQTVTKAFNADMPIVITNLKAALKVPAEQAKKENVITKKKKISTSNRYVIINKKPHEMIRINDNVFRNMVKSAIPIRPSKWLKYFKDLGETISHIWKDLKTGTFLVENRRGDYESYVPKEIPKTSIKEIKTTTAKRKPANKKKSSKGKLSKKGTVTIAKKEFKVIEIKESTFKKVKNLKSIKPSARNAYFKSLDIIDRLWKNKTEFYLLTHDGRYVKYVPVK